MVKFKNENVSHWRVRRCNKAVGQALSASWVGERGKAWGCPSTKPSGLQIFAKISRQQP